LETYNFQNFELKLLGGDVVGLRSFGFDHSADIEIINGKGSEAVGYAVNSYKRSCKATILFGELERLVKAAAPWSGDIIKLPPFPVVALSSPDGRPPMTYTVPKAKITKFSADFKEGDTKTEVPLEFAILSQPVILFA
jgi:hypothetical protein